MKEISLYVMSQKGYSVIRDIITSDYVESIDKVIISHDKNMVEDYYEVMLDLCKNAGLDVYDRNAGIEITSPYCMAISWRWLIRTKPSTKLIVLHDSLLPKYRGFSPLVNMLINREPFLGVTALYADDEYDKGAIIAQKKEKVQYPLKVLDAINKITPLYSELVLELIEKIKTNKHIDSMPQDDKMASYSLWRDEDDYCIDWNLSSEDVQQFVFSVGFPYCGASTHIDGEIVRIFDCELFEDVKIENRNPGKILLMDNGFPVVVCGKGLLKLTDVRKNNGEMLLPLKRFRTRFC